MKNIILLVEDNPDDEFAFRWAFKKTGVNSTLHVVADGEKAVNYLAGNDEYADRSSYPVPDVVFLDLKLPYRSGHEVLEWIREQPFLTSLAVVILSGSDEDSDQERARRNGAKGYLVKPLTPQQLLDVVSKFSPSYTDVSG